MKKLFVIGVLLAHSFAFAYEDEQKVAACFVYHVVQGDEVYAMEISKKAQDQRLFKFLARDIFEKAKKDPKTVMMYARGACRQIGARF